MFEIESLIMKMGLSCYLNPINSHLSEPNGPLEYLYTCTDMHIYTECVLTRYFDLPELIIRKSFLSEFI